MDYGRTRHTVSSLIRPILNEVLTQVVHARMSMDTLKAAIMEELQSGYRPTFRGHAWGVAQFDDLQLAASALEAAFHLLKGVQFPEMRQSRRSDLRLLLEQADSGDDNGGDGGNGTAEASPGDEPGELNHHRIKLGLDAIEPVV